MPEKLGEARLDFVAVGIRGEGFPLLRGEGGRGDAEGNGLEDGLALTQADGEAGVEGIAGADGVHRIYTQSRDGAHAVTGSPEDALCAARENDVLWTEIKQGAGKLMVVGGIVGRQAEADASLGFVRCKRENGGEIRVAEIAGGGGVEDGFDAVLAGQARAGKGGIEVNFQWRDDGGGRTDDVPVLDEVGGGKLTVGAGIDGDEIRADGIEEDDTDARGEILGVEDRFAVDSFAFEHGDKVGGKGVVAEFAEKPGISAEARGGDGGVRTFSTKRTMKVAANNGFAFDGKAVHVHDQGDDIAADDGDTRRRRHGEGLEHSSRKKKKDNASTFVRTGR